MAYIHHTWVDGEIITPEKMNNLEEGADEKSIPGPPGEQGPPGEPGPKGDGFTGEAVLLSVLEENADNSAITGKINEIIGILAARGVTKGA
ncbi:hypothetical protein [Phocaeicola sp.]|uniref:hypothetical protein n=1 Tax=Phocaeicola sp. TaxID=2773926 RepID=UPI002A804251|nr:hypothetical protein [Phocaeicola sp.]